MNDVCVNVLFFEIFVIHAKLTNYLNVLLYNRELLFSLLNIFVSWSTISTLLVSNFLCSSCVGFFPIFHQTSK